MYFERADLGSLGLVICLGHGGKPCMSGKHSSGLPGSKFKMGPEQGGDEWEDVDDDPWLLDERAQVQPSRLQPVPGARSMVVVTSAGIFRRDVCFCQCPGAPDPHLQLLRMQLFPASIERPSTAFTFEVLDHFNIDALECKTAALNFYNKLRRLTNNAFPGTCPVRGRCSIPGPGCE
jgi:hypothetical protein